MTFREIAAYEDRLKNLFRKARQITDLELQSHFARYICVLVSGYLEVSVRCVLREFMRTRSHRYGFKYIDANLERFQTPKADLILQLIGRFNSAWQDNLRVKIDGELKDAVNSIVNNRNQIAHGRNVGLSLGNMAIFYKSAQKVVQELKDTCK